MMQQPNRLGNVYRFASKIYGKQYSVTVTFNSKPVSEYQPSLAVALFSYIYYFFINFTDLLFSLRER